MKVLVACEMSQEVCKAFRTKGHEAYSCDIQTCSGGHPEWHILGDAWKGKRLRAFIDAVNSTFDIMDTAEFDNDNNASYLKETYGIDLSELISTEMTDRVQKGG